MKALLALLFFVTGNGCLSFTGKNDNAKKVTHMHYNDTISVRGVISAGFAAKKNGSLVTELTAYWFTPFASDRAKYNLQPYCLLATAPTEAVPGSLAGWLYKPVTVTGMFSIPLTGYCEMDNGDLQQTNEMLVTMHTLTPVNQPENLVTGTEDSIFIEVVLEDTLLQKDGYRLKDFICAIPDKIADQCKGKLIRICGWPQFFHTTGDDLRKQDKHGRVYNLQGRIGSYSKLHLLSVSILQQNRWKLLWHQ